MSQESGLTYRESGVDIDRANEAKKRIKELSRSTFNSSVISEIGAFAGLYRLDFRNLLKPILVSSADGVGTKLKIAFLTGIHNTVGIDLVSHCTNDILVQGAFPLFFLDYIGMGKLQPAAVEQIVKGLVQGCKQSQCVLLGGETAEMPGFYPTGEYDLVGFMVGIADEVKLFRTGDVEEGDILMGLPSSGLHTNGYSLVRKLFFEQEKLKIDTYVEELGKTVGEELLIPHRNYLPVIKELIRSDDLHGLAHITGGGITENLARVLPGHLDAAVRRGTWEVLPIFRFIRERGKVETDEIYRTLNMGLGMILIAAKERADRVQDFLAARGQQFYLIGEITTGTGKVRYL
ncbi:phosphoribosylformylglycinamidine cyclo-ligase [Acidobacteria bacterium AH-259-L09]|nr:phosphoribosylformylglycinamidine cyclo-ligase [Acidobacteria bacterium AH-259-L09]